MHIMHIMHIMHNILLLYVMYESIYCTLVCILAMHNMHSTSVYLHDEISVRRAFLMMDQSVTSRKL